MVRVTVWQLNDLFGLYHHDLSFGEVQHSDERYIEPLARVIKTNGKFQINFGLYAEEVKTSYIQGRNLGALKAKFVRDLKNGLYNFGGYCDLQTRRYNRVVDHSEYEVQKGVLNVSQIEYTELYDIKIEREYTLDGRIVYLAEMPVYEPNGTVWRFYINENEDLNDLLDEVDYFLKSGLMNKGASTDLTLSCAIDYFKPHVYNNDASHNVDYLLALTESAYGRQFTLGEFMKLFNDLDWSDDRKNSRFNVFHEIISLMFERRQILKNEGYDISEVIPKTRTQRYIQFMNAAASRMNVFLQNIDPVGTLTADVYTFATTQTGRKYIGTIACNLEATTAVWYVYYTKTGTYKNKVDSPDIAIERMMNRRNIDIAKYLGIH